VLGRKKRQLEELETLRRALRGRLNAELYNADSEHEQYAEASYDLLSELLGASESARSPSPESPTVASWLDGGPLVRNIFGWQDAPIAQLGSKGALLAGCEDWRDVDRGRLHALIEEALSASASELARASEHPDGLDARGRSQFVVIGLQGHDPDRLEREGPRIPGFEPLLMFVREQAGFRRLASIQEEHAELTLLRLSEQTGYEVPDESLPEFRRSQRRAWNLGVTLGLWDVLDLLPDGRLT
jgi:hypothetical protein